MISIAIVEDDKNELEQLKSCIERYSRETGEEFSVTAFKDGLAFLDGYRHGFDVVFMDINMPYESGIGVAKRLRVIDSEVCLIFVTQMAQYAISAFDVNARDYILKPVIYSAFAFRFERVLAGVRAQARRHRSIIVKSNKGAIKVDVNNIRYIEVIRHTVIYHTVGGDIEAWESLKNAESALGDLVGSRFERCNNCFLVNLEFVDRVEDDTVYVGKDELKMSRARKKAFSAAFTRYVGGGGVI